MHLILSYATGRRTEGVLLAVSPERMRVVVRRSNDTIELHRVDAQWISDDGEPVEIESWISDGSVETAEMFSRMVPRTYTARH